MPIIEFEFIEIANYTLYNYDNNKNTLSIIENIIFINNKG